MEEEGDSTVITLDMEFGSWGCQVRLLTGLLHPPRPWMLLRSSLSLLLRLQFLSLNLRWR
jgi:hypothetical protein